MDDIADGMQACRRCRYWTGESGPGRVRDGRPPA